MQPQARKTFKATLSLSSFGENYDLGGFDHIFNFD